MKLFGKKDSMFDWWSLVHFCCFVVMGANIEAMFKLSWYWHCIWIVIAAFGWEILERILEKKLPKVFRNKVESWSNSWIVDILLDIFGAVVGIWLVGQ